MKCFLVVNQLNNPVFLDFDTEFTKFIHRKAVELGLQDEGETVNDAEVDTAVVTQLFSPLVLSQVPLDDQVQNPCTSITCPNGFLLVFKKVDDIQYIAISGDEKDTVDFLQRKILVFMCLTKFLFGPVFMEIANCAASERTARWKFLKGVLHTWTHLATTDHIFLAEAVERLHVNQMVSEKCVGLLEKTVQRMQSLGDHPTQHAFLLVNTKLLALYSKRNSLELQPADILMTALLAHDMFPFKSSVEDLLASSPSCSNSQSRSNISPNIHSVSNPRSKHQQKPQGAEAERISDRDERSDENEEFHSAPNTPSQGSPTPHTDTDTAIDNPSKNLDRLEDCTTATVPGSEIGKEDPSTTSAIATTTTTTTTTQRAENGRKGCGEGEEETGDGGLERLMTTLVVEEISQHKTSSSSVNKESTTSSSAVEADYPSLSPETASGFGSVPTTSFLTALPMSDTEQRSRSSTTDAKHSYSSRKTPSDPSSSNAEIDPIAASQPSVDQSAQSSLPQSTMDNNEYWPHTVFLHTPPCQHAPHTLHCAQVLPGITVVVVSQMPGYLTANPLCQVLSIVQDLLQGRRNKLTRSQAVHVHDVVSDLLKKVNNKKIKKRAQGGSADVLARWEHSDMRDRLVNYLQQEETKTILPDLESSLLDLQRRLKELFQLLFILPGRIGGGGGDVEGMTQAIRDPMSKIKMKLQQELMDYRDYLSVKAQRNITMTSYLDDFPGLIHFIYIDRQFHQMTAPSFNIIPDQGKMNAVLFLKEKIWTMYGYMMKKLQQGYTSVLLREGDFYYSFFLWFEDGLGNPLPVQEPYKPSLETPLPGTLTGSFYKQLVRQCFPNRTEGSVHCYEMFLMHIGLVTPQYIAAHCQKLAHQLWEMSGEAYTPVNLL